MGIFYFLFVPGKTIAGVVHRARLFEFLCHLLISAIENAIVLLIKKAQLEKGAGRDSGRMWSVETRKTLSGEAQGSLRRTFPQLQHPTKYLRLREMVHTEDAKGHGDSHPTMEPAT